MALIKKFRIKNFKNKIPLAKVEKISLSYDKRQILDNINFNLSPPKSTVPIHSGLSS